MDYLIIYGLLGLGVLISLGAQFYVTSTYKKYSKIKSIKNITGAEAARKVLDNKGLKEVEVELSEGFLSDHYDPKSKVVRLSQKVYHETSISSIAVAVHECGHAVQDKDKYSFMRFRAAMFPLVNLASYGGYIAILIGSIFSLMQLIWVGIALEFVILFFQLVTLPVELNASKRALKYIEEAEVLDKSELSGGRRVLRAAASTYVASIAVVLLEIARLIFMFGRNND